MIWYVVGCWGARDMEWFVFKNDDDIDDVDDMNASCHSYVEPIRCNCGELMATFYLFIYLLQCTVFSDFGILAGSLWSWLVLLRWPLWGLYRRRLALQHCIMFTTVHRGFFFFFFTDALCKLMSISVCVTKLFLQSKKNKTKQNSKTAFVNVSTWCRNVVAASRQCLDGYVSIGSQKWRVPTQWS